MKYKIEIHWANPKRKETFTLPFECDAEFTNMFLDKISEQRVSTIEKAYTLIDKVKTGEYK